MAPAVGPAACPATQKDAWHSTAGASELEPAMRRALNYDDPTNCRKLTTGYVRSVRRTHQCPVLAGPR